LISDLPATQLELVDIDDVGLGTTGKGTASRPAEDSRCVRAYKFRGRGRLGVVHEREGHKFRGREKLRVVHERVGHEFTRAA
jgi:hypothetical protein